MLVRSLILAVLISSFMASAVAADEDHGRGRGRGQDNDAVQTVSANAVSIDLASGRAAAGAADPNVLVTLPGASSASAAMVCSSQPGLWAAALDGTAWISPIATCTSDQAVGQYRYDITFSLPSGATNLRLTGSLFGDDTTTAQLNGTGHPLTLSSAGGFTTPTTTFDTSDQTAFQAGTNTLSFFVNNLAGATGLDFRARVTTPNARTEGDQNNEGEQNHGQCVSEVAHDTAPGHGHGEAVSDAAHDCD